MNPLTMLRVMDKIQTAGERGEGVRLSVVELRMLLAYMRGEGMSEPDRVRVVEEREAVLREMS